MVFASPVELQAALANELGHPLLKRQRILATLRVSWYLRLGMFNKGTLNITTSWVEDGSIS